ncbi:MAG: hypothetical protein OCD76_23015 [Reichenbachiella sp.]
MKKQLLIFCLICCMTVLLNSCVDADLTAELDDLQSQIDDLKSVLESNSSITNIAVVDNQLVLTFADESTLITDLPEAPIPYVGDNGNWWVGNTDLGSVAEAQIPVIGANDNWWIDGEDTGMPSLGSNGVDGQNGSNGQDGINGSDGLTPYVGDNGNWWIGTVDSGIAAQGSNGSDGTNGTDGQNGGTPYIGDNGNWWVGTVDSGIAAQGSNGSDGTDGLDGTNGSDGANGTNGSDGTDGANGSDGTNGIDGTNGSDGTNAINGTDGVGIESVVYDQTTGILTITLDSGVIYDFLIYLEAQLQGVKLEDLNGEYLLSAIYNGDLPFIGFEYDANNRLSTVTYYTTVFNEPIKYLTVDRTYNGTGDILTQTFSQWATKKKAIQEGDEVPNREVGILMTVEEAVIEVFGGLPDSEASQIFGLTDISSLTSTFLNQGISFNSYVYRFLEEWNEDLQINELVVRKHMESQERPNNFGVSDIGTGDIYIWTPDYYINPDDNVDQYWQSTLPTISAYSSGWIGVDEVGGLTISSSSYSTNYYDWGELAIDLVGDVNEVTATSVDNYIATTDEEFENPHGVNGDYKALFRSYSLYNSGDLIDSYSIDYSYDGSTFTINDNDLNEDVLRVTVVNDEITTVSVRDPDAEVPAFEDELGFTYTDGKLTGIAYLKDNASDLMTISYDNQGNPIDIAINTQLIKPTAEDIANEEGVDEEALEFLGLIYSYDEWDVDLGMMVEKYYYPAAASSVITMSYNYEMKNFMNHTFTAINPLMSFFDASNAMSGIGWAGHGSALFTEYEAYNEGGYPTSIKTYIQVSASDVPLDTGELEDFGIPINGSIAVSYRLEYVLKQ